MRVQAGILEFLLSGPPRLDVHVDWHGMDMDQVWLIFFINFFSALEGVEIAFLFSLAGGVGIEYRSWTCSLFSYR